MKVYPYTSPIILTDNIFSAYGGDVILTSGSSRAIAFLMAEELVSSDLDTYLLPTIITGVYPYAGRLVLDVGNVHQIYRVRFMDSLGAFYYSVTGSYNYYTHLWDTDYGILDIDYIFRHGNLGTYPFHLEVVLQAGLVSGSTYHPNVLMALTKYATVMLNEIVGWGNESTGDVGVQSFSNQQYSERRTALKNTAYGNSAVAQLIHRLLATIRKYRRVGI